MITLWKVDLNTKKLREQQTHERASAPYWEFGGKKAYNLDWHLAEYIELIFGMTNQHVERAYKKP